MKKMEVINRLNEESKKKILYYQTTSETEYTISINKKKKRKKKCYRKNRLLYIKINHLLPLFFFLLKNSIFKNSGYKQQIH